MKIKKDDSVMVMRGKDRGKSGKVIRALPRTSQVIVAGVNIKKVYKRATRSDKKSQLVEQAYPVHVSNVMIVDPKTDKPTRVGYEKKEGKNVRIAKRSGSALK